MGNKGDEGNDVVWKTLQKPFKSTMIPIQLKQSGCGLTLLDFYPIKKLLRADGDPGVDSDLEAESWTLQTNTSVKHR